MSRLGYVVVLLVVLGVVQGSPEQEVGACCFVNSACAVLNRQECLSSSGEWAMSLAYPTPYLQRTCELIKPGNFLPCPWILEPFKVELPIPSEAVPESGIPGCDDGSSEVVTYSIQMIESQTSLHPDLPGTTTFWGYEGSLPGPTFRVCKDQKVVVNWMNDLRDTSDSSMPLRTRHLFPTDFCPFGPNMYGTVPRTVVHLHGGINSAQHDGNPSYAFFPGQSSSSIYYNNQSGSTLWYHDNALGISSKNIYAGLYGMYVVEDLEEEDLRLPSGSFDIPIIISSVFLDGNGQLWADESTTSILSGYHFLVNGKITPYLNVQRKLYRFRILNAIVHRDLTLVLQINTELENNPVFSKFTVIGTEGGLLDAPVKTSKITIAPGERLDVIIDFQGLDEGDYFDLTDITDNLFIVPIMRERRLLRFIATKKSYSSPRSVPTELIPLPSMALTPSMALRNITLYFEEETQCPTSLNVQWRMDIDGVKGDWDHINLFPVAGTSEIWDIWNPTTPTDATFSLVPGGVPVSHSLHLHGAVFRVMYRRNFTVNANGAVNLGDKVYPAKWERGWKDTLLSKGGDVTRILVYYNDNTGKFAVNCNNFIHQDNQMLRQIRITNPAYKCNFNELCESSEDCLSCPNDCPSQSGAHCGNDLCEVANGEDCTSCPEDCKVTTAGCCGFDGTCGDGCIDNKWFCTTEFVQDVCCGDMVCDPLSSEDEVNCPIDCTI